MRELNRPHYVRKLYMNLTILYSLCMLWLQKIKEKSLYGLVSFGCLHAFSSFSSYIIIRLFSVLYRHRQTQILVSLSRTLSHLVILLLIQVVYNNNNGIILYSKKVLFGIAQFSFCALWLLVYIIYLAYTNDVICV